MRMGLIYFLSLKRGGGGLLEKIEDLRWTCFLHFYSPLRVKTLLCAAKAFQSIAVFLTPQLHSDRSKLLFSCNIWDELESLRIVQTPQANLRGFSIVPPSWRFSWASVASHALSKKNSNFDHGAVIDESLRWISRVVKEFKLTCMSFCFLTENVKI